MTAISSPFETDLDPGDIARLLDSWDLSLRAANLSPKTIKSYEDSARQLLAFLRGKGMPTAAAAVSREHIEAFLVDLGTRWSSSTVATRYRCLQQLFRWLLDEGEISSNPMARMRPPATEERPVPVVADEDLKRLLATCAGSGFDDRRDLALLSLLIDTGARRAEIAGLVLDDVDLRDQQMRLRGKGRRERDVSIGLKAAKAVDRYLRARARHPHAASLALWVGVRGPMTDSGVAQVVRRRGSQAGLPGLRPHQLRHTWASAWLRDGGPEADLMRLGGWRTRQMIDRYGASAADDRARSTHKRISLGDQL